MRRPRPLSNQVCAPLLRVHSECVVLRQESRLLAGAAVTPPYREGLLPGAAATWARQEPRLLPCAAVTPPYRGG